ncbi:ATP synthase F0 subunit B [bacterium]|nr:ATP synthase F0 subunit B [bacterium]
MIELNYTFFIQAINFIILLVVLERVFYRPVRSFLSERNRHQKDCLNAAERDRVEMDTLKREYQKMLHQARDQAQQVQAHIIRQAEQKAVERLAMVKAEQNTLLSEAREQLDLEVRAIHGTLSPAIHDLADEIVKRVTDRQD